MVIMSLMSNQIFNKKTNYVIFFLLIGLILVGGFVFHLFDYWFSPKNLNVGYSPEQPIPFSHQIHAGKLGMDCRYCHTYVDRAAHSNIPATEVCMNCHKQVKVDSPHIKKLTNYYNNNEPIPWVKVHMLPDYAYFNHSAHVNAGFSCATCHGRVDQMEVVYQAQPLSMGWCLECHREPEKFVRPKAEVYNMSWEPGPEHDGVELVKEYHLNPKQDCGVCHR